MAHEMAREGSVHLQIKVAFSTSSLETPGAAPRVHVTADPRPVRPGQLADLAEGLAREGINLRAVSGHGIETGGWLGLSVDDGQEGRVYDYLDRGGYRYEVQATEERDLHDRPGELARFARELAERGLLVDSLTVGTPARDGTIPVAATTFVFGAQAGSTPAGHSERR